uniref:Uncharacterized protein n=1 Tax=Photinus pyralis TaxID=7054 RepID=A0A1Y1KLG3_PHOPY
MEIADTIVCHKIDNDEINTVAKSLFKTPTDTSSLQNELVSAALELINLAKKTVDTSILATATKQVKTINALLEIGSNLNEQELNIPVAMKREPANKNISKQMQFFSTKRSHNKSKAYAN